MGEMASVPLTDYIFSCIPRDIAEAHFPQFFPFTRTYVSTMVVRG